MYMYTYIYTVFQKNETRINAELIRFSNILASYHNYIIIAMEIIRYCLALTRKNIYDTIKSMFIRITQ